MQFRRAFPRVGSKQMSKINSGLYSSESHTWCTPPDFIETLLDFEDKGLFDLDPCCSQKNIPAHNYYIDGIVDGLQSDWVNSSPDHKPLVFVNPPYGKVLKDWVRKCHYESLRGCKVWLLIPARTETIYQHDSGLTKAGFTVFLKGRMKFLQNGESKGTAPFPTMLLYYGNDSFQKAIKWNHRVPMPGTLMRAL